MLVYKFFLISKGKSDVKIFVENVKDYLKNNVEYDSLMKAVEMFDLDNIEELSEIKLIKLNSLINFYNELVQNIEKLPIKVQEAIVLEKYVYKSNINYDVSSKFISGKLVKDLQHFYNGFHLQARYTLNIEKYKAFMYEYEFKNCAYLKSIQKQGIYQGFNIEEFNEATKILNRHFKIFQELEFSDDIVKRNEFLKPKIDIMKKVVDARPKLGEGIEVTPEIHNIIIQEINWIQFEKNVIKQKMSGIESKYSDEKLVLIIMLETILYEWNKLDKEYQNNLLIIEKFKKEKIVAKSIVSGFKKESAFLKNVSFKDS
jgi:hypothetical protein